jgi:UDP-hydrolysing UDP-N-acetyl-D-glucosamine 2-epimerase
MRKVCVVITARPSYSRIRTALDAIDAHAELELQLVVASSALLDRYGHALAQIESDGFRPDAHVYTLIEGENPTTMAKSTGLGLLELASVFDQLRPDVVLTVADRFETMATAVAASYMNIPLAHVQGGEITGSIDEKVRHAVTKLADLHLVSTDQAAEFVRRMGEQPEAVHVTGCPSIDLAAEVAEAAERSPGLPFDPMVRYGGVGASLDLDDGYLVVMQHPVTTEHELARAHVLETLHAVHELDVPTLWFWPNPDAGTDGTSNGIRLFREQHQPRNLHFFKNMAPTDFLHLLLASRGLVGNSSVGIRESSFLGIPVVNVGTRQEGRERGHNVVDVGYDRAEIEAATREQMAQRRFPCDARYGDGKAGRRIADVLAGAPLTTTKKLAY